MSKITHSRNVISAAFAALAVAALTLTGCATTETPQPAATMADQVTVTDAWVKEPTMAMADMTGMFAVIENTGTSEVVLVGGSTDVANMIEVHEVTDGKMREIDGGLAIVAGATSTLAPGGNHIMLMDLTTELLVGEEITVTLTFADGSTLDVTATVKTAAGGNETYEEKDNHDHDHDHEDGKEHDHDHEMKPE